MKKLDSEERRMLVSREQEGVEIEKMLAKT
jgi:hypothetical protein